eukprot:CAMPEP_0182856836 /NCGR_PEP_ID=MMETSP0034_2-20130328/2687_1 /TAXON_ID=156128 /ORGANISM="Nephroselmis pyriformis, Strain CCMP717" /LENGTH=378 /DNA_ID=CAMNT_0024987989 /DNA_START=11 /DNA_END=1147 /DNA_ORIENTATION=-
MASSSSICPNLMKPGKVGAVEIKNRVVLAPLTRARTGADRVPTAHMIEYYKQRASSGFMVSEATVVDPLANGWVKTPGIYNDEQVEGWKKVTEGVHDEGGVIFCQLWFIGRAGHSSFMKAEAGCDQIVSAGDIAIPGDGEVHGADGKKYAYEAPRPLTEEEIPSIVAMYGKAAKLAKEAGFDGVEIHGANGYLIDQFFQTCSNNRTDKYGGSMENRYRFCKEIVAEVKKHWPADRIGLRISPNGNFNGMGSEDNVDVFTYVATELGKEDLAYLHVMDGLGFGYHEKAPVMELKDFRPLFPNTLVGNCGYTMEMGEERIKSGEGDCIAYGRPYLANPDLPERFANGWELAENPAMEYWFSGADGFDGPKGYSDFETYKA